LASSGAKGRRSLSACLVTKAGHLPHRTSMARERAPVYDRPVGAEESRPRTGPSRVRRGRAH
jgi:hypothetical protein